MNEFNPDRVESYFDDFIDECEHSRDFDVIDAINDAIQMYLIGKTETLINMFVAYLNMRFPDLNLGY